MTRFHISSLGVLDEVEWFGFGWVASLPTSTHINVPTFDSTVAQASMIARIAQTFHASDNGLKVFPRVLLPFIVP